MKNRNNRTSVRARQAGRRASTAKGRREDVRGSGIYPVSGPWPKGRARIVTQGELGRGERSRPASARRGANRSRNSALGQTATSSQARRDIVRSEWREFLDHFSTQHERWAVEIQVFQPDQTFMSSIQRKRSPLKEKVTA